MDTLQELMNRYYYITLVVSILVCTFAIPLVYITLKLLLTCFLLSGGLLTQTIKKLINKFLKKG